MGEIRVSLALISQNYKVAEKKQKEASSKENEFQSMDVRCDAAWDLATKKYSCSPSLSTSLFYFLQKTSHDFSMKASEEDKHYYVDHLISLLFDLAQSSSYESSSFSTAYETYAVVVESENLIEGEEKSNRCCVIV